MELTGAELAPCMASTAGLNNIGYSLSAVICHTGWSFSTGHYIGYVKHDDDWFYCNDSTVYRVHENEVRHNRDAYVCFYIRHGSAEKQERSRPSKSVIPQDEIGQGASAEVFQLSPPRGDGSTPGDPREHGCSWGSTPPSPQPAEAMETVVQSGRCASQRRG